MFDSLKMKIANMLVKNSAGSINDMTAFFRQADFEDRKRFVLSDAYRQHAYVNIAVEKIAQNIVRAPMEIFEGDNLVETGPVYDLFRDVNPQMSRAQLFEATMSWVLIRGECIWVLSNTRKDTITGIPEEIYIYDPQYFIEFLNAKKTKVVLWKYKIGAEEVPFSTDQIIHFRKWNPWNQFRGVNPLIAQESELSEDIYVNESNIALLKNRSVPSGLLTSEQALTEGQAKDILDMWNKSHGGTSKKGKIGVLGSGTKYQQISMTPADMEFYKMKQWNRSTILGKYGVPAIVAGFKDDKTPLSGDDSKEQMKLFWDLTLLPHIKFLEDKLTTEFFGRFAPTMRVKFNTSDIQELQEDLEKLADRIREDVAAGLITINEGREQRNLDDVPWGNTWYKPMSLVAVDQQPEEKEEENKLSLFGDENVWTEIYKSAHWYSVINKIKLLETSLKKELQSWIQVQRSCILEELSKSNTVSIFRKFNVKFWNKQKAELKRITDKVIVETSAVALEDAKKLLTDLSIDQKYLDFITEASAETDNQIVRLYDEVFNNLKDCIKKGDMDAVRERYKIIQSRFAKISHIETGRIVNKVRMRAYTAVGITHHQWLSSRGKDLSKISIFESDKEIVKIGEKFSNGQKYPFDIINEDVHTEYALTLPIIRRK